MSRTATSSILLGDPFGTYTARHVLGEMTRRAAAYSRPLVAYKTSARIAANLHAAGHVALRIGREAVLSPGTFSVETPNHRQLRRKLRQAEKAGVEIRDTYTVEQLAPIDAAWQQRNGAAKGFSMGRFSAELIARQRVLVAKHKGEPVAFISFNTTSKAWSLDLIRSLDGCPDGVIHMLVIHAIEAAKSENVARFSLASAPLSGLDASSGHMARLMTKRFAKNASLKGLNQFKTSFAPDWKPLYMTAPGWFDLFCGILDLYRLINRPEATPPSPLNQVHNHYGNYEFDTSPENR